MRSSGRYSRPDYAEKFRCISSACEDNCCSGWTIPVDRHTLEDYRADPILRPFTSLLVLNTPAEAGHAASMPLTHTGRCAFLDGEHLCGIHRHFGPAKLSDACTAYPRESTRRRGEIETALNLSCPEAARLVLLDPSLLIPVPSAAGSHDRAAAIGEEDVKLASACDPVLEVQEFCLSLVADRSRPLSERLRSIGFLSAALQSVSEAACCEPATWVEKHPQVLARLLARFSIQPKKTSEAGSLSNAARQLHLVAAILSRRLQESPISSRFQSCLAQVQEGLQLCFLEPKISRATVHAYVDASRTYLAPLLAEHPYLLENLTANHIYKYQYPFGRQPKNLANLNQNHAFLCTQLMLVQTLLGGLAARHRQALDTGHVVTLVQTLARAIEHRRSTLEWIASLVQEHGLEGVDALATLVELPT